MQSKEPPMKPATRITVAFPLTVAVVGYIGILAGCGSSASTGASSSAVPLSSGRATQVYVSQPDFNANGSVVQFPTTVNGSVLPTTKIVTPPTAVNSYLAADKAGQLYIGSDASSPEVLVFPSGASGSVSAARIILGDSGSFSEAGPLALDSDSNLYVVDPTGSISIFSPTANGAATPLRHIQGPLTELADSAVPDAISVDVIGNIYVSLASTSASATQWKIIMFSPSAEGNVAPSRVITAENNCSLYNSSQVALDVNGNFYVACIEGGAPAITEFVSNENTIARPVKTITGAAARLGTVLALSVDTAGNIYVVSYTENEGLSLEAFSSAVSGNVGPAVRLTSGSLTSVFPALALR
jgi:hypothetical protein